MNNQLFSKARDSVCITDNVHKINILQVIAMIDEFNLYNCSEKEMVRVISDKRVLCEKQ